MKITSKCLNYKSKNSGFQKSKNEKNIITRTTENQEIQKYRNSGAKESEIQ